MNVTQKELEASLDVLNVAAGHNWSDVQQQYRLLVQQWHPDRHSEAGSSNAQSRFIEINNAYKLVKDYHRKHGMLPHRQSTSAQNRNANASNRAHVSARHDTAKLQHGKLWHNPKVITTALMFSVLFTTVALFWALDNRMAINNRNIALTTKVQENMAQPLSNASHSDNTANDVRWQP